MEKLDKILNDLRNSTITEAEAKAKILALFPQYNYSFTQNEDKNDYYWSIMRRNDEPFTDVGYDSKPIGGFKDW